MKRTFYSRFDAVHAAEADDLAVHFALAVDEERRAVLVRVVRDAVVRDDGAELGRGVQGGDFGEEGRKELTLW